MSMNIYIGNLPYGSSEDDLRQAFGRFGEVTSAVVITDKQSGRSKGFGFVEMSDEGAAQEAIDAMNGQDFQGRTVKVNQARPKTSHSNSDTAERF